MPTPSILTDYKVLIGHKERFLGHLLYLHVSREVDLYSFYLSIYGNTHDPRESSGPLAYILRVGEQDFEDGYSGACCFPGIWEATK